jgi:hypothetical protein
MTRTVGIGRVVCAILGGLVATLPVPPIYRAAAQEQSSAAAPRQYDIPADRLDRALAAFADTSNVDIIYDNALARGRRSTAVSGRYSPPQALAILLAGTGLSWRFTQARAVVIFAGTSDPASTTNEASEPYAVLTLDTLRVRASPVIGSTSRAPFTAYSEWVLAELYRRILPEREPRARAFRGEIQFWIDDQGVVSRLEFLRRTGDGEADRLIESRIVGARFERTPPPGLPQPLRFMIEGRK